jgi:hypothetical protein
MTRSVNLNNNTFIGGVVLPSKADCVSPAFGGVLFGGNMICRVCKEDKNELEFHKGHLKNYDYICKKCFNAKLKAKRNANSEEYNAKKREYRKNNLEKVRAWTRKGNKKWRAKTDPDGAKQRAYSKKYYQLNKKRLRKQDKEYYNANPLKNKAWSAFWNAKKYGKITAQPCEVCGTNNRIEGHHPDYNKPLDVIWLCVKHHREVHNEILRDRGE